MSDTEATKKIGRPRTVRRPTKAQMLKFRKERLSAIQCLERLGLSKGRVREYLDWERDEGLPARRGSPCTRPSDEAIKACRAEGLSIEEAIERLGLICANNTYRNWERDAGLVPRREDGKLTLVGWTPAIVFEKTTLQDMIDKGMTAAQMATQLQVSKPVLYRNLKQHKLEVKK
jgi:DNA-binding transcriptional MerR regulator